jgi:hypothetical protein
MAHGVKSGPVGRPLLALGGQVFGPMDAAGRLLLLRLSESSRARRLFTPSVSRAKFCFFSLPSNVVPSETANARGDFGSAGSNRVRKPLFRRALVERPNAVWIYRALAAALSGADRIEEAKQTLVEVLRYYPDLTISKVRQAMVFSDAALDRMAENFRRLGLPD